MMGLGEENEGDDGGATVGQTDRHHQQARRRHLSASQGPGTC